MKILVVDNVRRTLDAEAGLDNVARSCKDGLKRLRSEKWNGLCLNYSLGKSQETGVDVLKVGFQEQIIPGIVKLVTKNAMEKASMENLLKENGYQLNVRYSTWFKPK